MLLALILLSVSACGTNGPALKPGCEWARPIWLSPADVLTPGTEDQIIAHNETWERVCQ